MAHRLLCHCVKNGDKMKSKTMKKHTKMENTAIIKAIHSLQEEIKEKENQIQLLSNVADIVDKQGFTEELYHKLCETEMRNSDELGKAIAKVLPFLTFQKTCPNYFRFIPRNVYYTDCDKRNVECLPDDASGIFIEIPSTAETVAYISVTTYYSNERRKNIVNRYEIEKAQLEKNIALANEYLNTQNPWKQIKIMYPHKWWAFAVFSYVFTNPTKQMKKKLADNTKALDDILSKYMNEIEDFNQKRHEQQKNIELYSQLLLNWTNKVRVVLNHSSYSSNEVAEITRNSDNAILIKEM